MLSYFCERCDGIECETSVCPVCGSRTVLKGSKIFWSKEFNVPCFDEYNSLTGEKCHFVGSDIRPVFPQERLLIEILLKKPMCFAGKSFWATSNNTYIADGEKIKIYYKKIIKEMDVYQIIEVLHKYEEQNRKYCDSYLSSECIRNFIKINQFRLNCVESEAIQYIKENAFNKKINEMFVSFSGGKDSTVVSDLVTRALGTKSIIHIYGDTTLEYPASGEYISRFRKKNPTTPLLVAKNNDQDFNDLCDVIGPPSRVLRWCCTVFKTGAITKKIESTFKNMSQIISFQGIRRNESTSRSKYERESMSPKIAKQIVLSPIIDWLDFDVWLYILGNGLDFNDAYKQGFTRVGCWCCPNNSDWSAFLSSIYMNEQYTEFQNLLYRFAKKVGKEDWKVYVDTGKWKARQGGQGLEASANTAVAFKPCAFEENAYNFELTRPISESLYILFKPFGSLNFQIGNKRLNEVYVLDKKSNQPLLRLSGRIGSRTLKIAVLGKHPAFKNQKIIESLLRAQITKYQSCLACSGCQSVCKFDALKVINTSKGSVSLDSVLYTIDTDKCVGCLKCVNHYDSGCYMYKVLKTKTKR